MAPGLKSLHTDVCWGIPLSSGVDPHKLPVTYPFCPTGTFRPRDSPHCLCIYLEVWEFFCEAVRLRSFTEVPLCRLLVPRLNPLFSCHPVLRLSLRLLVINKKETSVFSFLVSYRVWGNPSQSPEKISSLIILYNILLPKDFIFSQSAHHRPRA